MKDNLKHDILEDLNLEGEAWLWLRIGRGKRSWNFGNYYREHRKLGVSRLETEAKQESRLEGFLTVTKRVVILGNVAILGDFNVNLDPTSTDSSNVTLRLKDKLLNTFPLAGLVQMVEKCTRHCRGRKSSLIDGV